MEVTKVVEIKTEQLCIQDRCDSSFPYCSFFVDRIGRESEMPPKGLLASVPVQIRHYEIVNLSYPIFGPDGVGEVVKHFLVPVDDLTLFQQLYYVDKTLLDALINAKAKDNYDFGKEMGEVLERQIIRKLPWWKRLLKRF